MSRFSQDVEEKRIVVYYELGTLFNVDIELKRLCLSARVSIFVDIIYV